MQRISLTIEYDGTNFAGWQMQQGRRTIQAELEQALSVIANQPIQVMASGRTDAGVHALQQVLHFDTNIDRSEYSWVVGTNRYLPAEIRVLSAQIMPSDFHARYSALARWYRYLILNRAMNSALYGRLNTWRNF
jgi:tRNA pseudouridine38-40 synthase